MLNIQINPSEMNHKNSLFMLNLQLSLKSECMLVICDISSKIFKLISIILLEGLFESAVWILIILPKSD